MRKGFEKFRFARRGLCMLLCLLMMLSIAPQAFAIDMIEEDRICSLTIEYYYGEMPIDGAVFKLYRVAEMTDFGTFTLTGQFAGDPVEVNDLNAEKWEQLAATLTFYVDSEDRPADIEAVIEGGKAVFSDLPVGLYLVLGETFIQDNKLYLSQPIITSLPDHSDPLNSDNWVYDVTIQPKAGEFGEGQLKIRKVWSKDDAIAHDRPRSVTINLLVDGEVYDTAVIGRDNDWQTEFTKTLPSGANWSIEEINIPDGYKFLWRWEYDGESILITAINRRETPPPPDLPQTGMLWWPVPVLAVAGMLLFAFGWMRRRNYEE